MLGSASVNDLKRVKRRLDQEDADEIKKCRDNFEKEINIHFFLLQFLGAMPLVRDGFGKFIFIFNLQKNSSVAEPFKCGKLALSLQ